MSAPTAEAYTTNGIKAALALVATPAQWTKTAAARTREGIEVEYWDERAAAFCFVSALYRVGAQPHEEAAVRRLVPGGMIGLWNDHPKREHGDVLRLGQRAIEAIEKDRAKADRRARASNIEVGEIGPDSTAKGGE